MYTQWARQYGDIFYYRAFSRHIYFLNNPEFAKYILVTNYQDFIKGEAIRFNRRIFGNGLFDQLRELLIAAPAPHPTGLPPGQNRSYPDTMVAHTERMMATWRDGETRDIHLDMMRLGLEIVAKALFNVDRR